MPPAFAFGIEPLGVWVSWTIGCENLLLEGLDLGSSRAASPRCFTISGCKGIGCYGTAWLLCHMRWSGRLKCSVFVGFQASCLGIQV